MNVRPNRILLVAASKGLLLLLLVLLSACTTQLPVYKPYSGGVGYQDRQIEKNRVKLVYVGNSAMDADSTENYLLYRAAELTEAEGYSYFILHGKRTSELGQTRYFSRHHGNRGFANSSYYGYYGSRRYSGYGGYYGRNVYWDDPFSYNYPGVCCAYNTYKVSAEVIMYLGEKPEDNLDAYLAHEVLQYLRSNIHRATSVLKNDSPTLNTNSE